MGGRRIDDHGSWLGSTKGGNIPKECKIKEFAHGEGAGTLNVYQDTEDKIKRTQDETVRKIKANPPKEGYRN